MKSPKQLSLEKRILKKLSGLPRRAAEILFRDEEILYLQDYANIVSIKRLGYNDHGPVHMNKVVLNAVEILSLLHESGINLSLEREEAGTFEDSTIAVLLASFLHDLGMTVGRENHEQTAVLFALPLIERVLKQLYPEDLKKRTVLRSLSVEGIMGHMGTQKIHSLEAGTILIADGCDMERGRARIPIMISTESRIGDIHKYSSSAIRSVKIGRGAKNPVRITVIMNESVGFFQVEEVLLKKIGASPVKQYVELFAGVADEKLKQYTIR